MVSPGAGRHALPTRARSAGSLTIPHPLQEFPLPVQRIRRTGRRFSASSSRALCPATRSRSRCLVGRIRPGRCVVLRDQPLLTNDVDRRVAHCDPFLNSASGRGIPRCETARAHRRHTPHKAQAAKNEALRAGARASSATHHAAARKPRAQSPTPSCGPKARTCLGCCVPLVCQLSRTGPNSTIHSARTTVRNPLHNAPQGHSAGRSQTGQITVWQVS